MVKTARVRHDGVRVVLECDNGPIPWQQARKLGRALIRAARLAEAEDQAERIIADAALGIRAGFPIGLAPTERHAVEALKSAQWDSHLRKGIPTVRAAGAVYAPAVRSLYPK